MSADLGDIMEQVQTAKIAVSAAVYAIDKPYSYRITPAFAEKIRPGMRVTVPFGRGNRHVEGVVLATGWEPEGEKLKSIEALLDQTPAAQARSVDAGPLFLHGLRGRQGHAARRYVV